MVPAGVSSISVEAIGAKGANGNGAGIFGSGGGAAGRGGKVVATLSVTAGTTLHIFVGNTGTNASGGYNGGGNGRQNGGDFGGGGGGATDIRIGGTALSDRILVAGGGGGGGVSPFLGLGGYGGGLTGSNGGGSGGSQSSGGSGNASGSLGTGGNAGGSNLGAGGGGGYYGGGGTENFLGGGGGSSFTDPILCSNVLHTQGSNNVGAGSLTISYCPTIAAFSVTGGGSVACIYPINVGLSGSESSMTYQLKRDGSNVGSPVNGTGAAISFGQQEDLGTYTVVATASNGCTAAMTGSVAVTEDETEPTAYGLTFSGSSCSGGSGVTLGLAGSQTGVSYRLIYEYYTYVGSPVAGTGNAVSFGTQTVGGYYAVVATNNTSGCTRTMDITTLTFNPAPAAYSVTGGGSYFSGGAGVAVGLDNSAVGVNYQLQKDGSNTGSAVAGTGAALDFGNQTAAGHYTVVATDATTGCTAAMTGSASVIVVPSALCVAYCNGTNITLTYNSTYDAYENPAYPGLNLYFVSWETPQFWVLRKDYEYFYDYVSTSPDPSGTYVFSNGYAAPCPVSVTVSANTTTTYAVTGGGSYCSGSGGVAVGLAGSQVGVSYQLKLDGANDGSPVVGTGSALSFGNKTAVGTYTVVATPDGGGCTADMTGNATVVINPTPAVFEVTGGGTYCFSEDGSVVGLSDSEAGVSYQLKKNGLDLDDPFEGYGGAFDFGERAAGTYTILATNIASGCTALMGGSAVSTSTNFCVDDIDLSNASDCMSQNTSCTSDDIFTADLVIYFGEVPPSGELVISSNALIGGLISIPVSELSGTSHTLIGVAFQTGDPDPFTIEAGFTLTGDLIHEVSIANIGTCSLPLNANDIIFNGLDGYCGTIFNNTLFSPTQVVNGTVAFETDGGDGIVRWTGSEWELFLTFGVQIATAPGNPTQVPCSGWVGAEVQGFSCTATSPTVSGGCDELLDPSPSEITSISLADASNCKSNANANPADDYFTSNVTVNFTFAPASGNLTLKRGSTVVAIKYASELACETSWTFENIQMTADGASIILTATFDDGTTFTSTSLGTAPVCICQAIRYVKPTATGTGDGTSWANASGDLQEMLDGACAEQVWVAAGTYKPAAAPLGCTNCGAERDRAFLLRNGVKVYGGFAGTEGEISERTAGNETIFSGDIDNDGILNNGNAYHVLVANNLGETSLLDGVTVSGGYAYGNTPMTLGGNTFNRHFGGGLVSVGADDFTLNKVKFSENYAGEGGGVANNSGSMIFTNCTFDGNYGDSGGGGIYIYGGEGTVSNCTFTANGSDDLGGAINAYDATCTILNSTFEMNTGYYAGAVYFYGNGSSATGCTFNQNSAPYNEGGAVYVDGEDITFTDCTFSENTAGSGGAIYNNYPITVTDCIFSENTATYDGGAIYNYYGGDFVRCSFLNNSTEGNGGALYMYDNGTFKDCLFAGNSAASTFQAGGAIYNNGYTSTLKNCTIANNHAPNSRGGGISIKGGNFTLSNCILWGNTDGNADLMTKQFYKNGGNTTISYSIYQDGLPTGATDGGNNSTADPLFANAAGGDFTLQSASPAINTGDNTGVSATDLAGNPRVAGGTVDLGAYESQCAIPVAQAVTGGGAYCSGGTGVVIGLGNSESGVQYQLKNGANNVGDPVGGTGTSLSFGDQTATGTYTVVATRTDGGCTAAMTGSVTVTVNALPMVQTITGGGSYCSGGTGVAIGLANSESGVQYQLKNGANNVGGPLGGTGTSLSFGNQTAAGTYTVVATRTAGGCTAAMTGSATVTVADLNLTGCSNVAVDAASTGCQAAVSIGVPTVASSECASVVTLSNSFNNTSNASGNYPVGITTVVWTATSGTQTATCSFTVTVTDRQNPSIGCPGNITRTTDANQCSAAVTYTNPTFSDNCSGAYLTRTSGFASGSVFPKGTSMVDWKVTDASGNMSVCQFTVTVNDTQAPSINCPSNLVRNADAGLCTAAVTYATPTATDNCTGVTVTLSSAAGTASGSVFPKGITTVTWQASDAASPANTKSCSFTVTVNDTQVPSIACPANQTSGTDPNACTAVITYASPTATDNCSPSPTVTLQSGLASGSTFPKGVTTVAWKATDAAGLTKTCTFRVTVNDTEAPAITCPSSQSVNTATNACTSAPVNYATPTATDNCAPAPTVVRIGGPTSGSSFALGTTNVIWRAIDGAGRSSTCSFAVTVTDATLPVISCPQSMSVTGSGSSCTATVGYTTPTATDNCGIQSVFLLSGQPSGSTFSSGVTVNTWRALDNSGMSATCSFTVTVGCGTSSSGMMNSLSRQVGNELRMMNQDDTERSSFLIPHLSLNLFPNPATTEVQISIENLSESGGELTVTDAQGRLMWQSNVQYSISNIALDNFAAGVYFVTLRSEGQMVAKRLVVNRL